MLVTNDPWIIAGVIGCYNILKVPVCKAEPVGKRISKNVYAKTREECEEKLAKLIKTMKAEIAAEKKKAKQA